MFAIPWAVIITAGYVLAIVLVVRVVLQRREPAATLAWAMSIVLIPYLGVLAYMFFGRRRLNRQVRRRQAIATRIAPDLSRLGEAVEELTADGELPHSLTAPASHELIRLTNRIGTRPLTVGNRVQLFVNANATYLAMERAIREARQHINVEYYIFQPDATGRRFRDLLAERARDGIAVRVLTDGVGSFGVEEFMEPLLAAGARFAEFLPVRLVSRLHTHNLRNHRKLLVIDGQTAFTGGINIGDEYTGQKRRIGPWRDTHLRIDGPGVCHVQEVFAEDWHFATAEEPDESWFPPLDAVGNVALQIVASGPDTESQPLQRIFFTAIATARSRVYLTTPYFIPDQAMRVALETAALRGVDVRLLLPQRSDMRLVLFAGRSYYDELLRAGVRIFEYEAGMLHAKTMVVDDTWATVGSANMDIRSFRLNFEINAAIYGPAFANELGKVFLQDLKRSTEVTSAIYQTRRWPRRVAESFARMLSPLL
ncbi:MAG: cardiolipin synthase [Deltaproteobacteria bacterium]|nr:cardiolipin synthase [Deltaproteobacteria bacterium]